MVNRVYSLFILFHSLFFFTSIILIRLVLLVLVLVLVVVAHGGVQPGDHLPQPDPDRIQVFARLGDRLSLHPTTTTTTAATTTTRPLEGADSATLHPVQRQQPSGQLVLLGGGNNGLLLLVRVVGCGKKERTKKIKLLQFWLFRCYYLPSQY